MSVTITPEADDFERRAILAALAAEEAEQRAGSERTAVLLPALGDETDP